MKEMNIRIDKENVYAEVEKSAAYRGAKKGETGAYDRISLTDENREMLDRFWTECRGTVEAMLREVLAGEHEANGQWAVELRVSELLDETQVATMELNLTNYFVQEICSKWFAMTSAEDDATTMAARAAASLETARQLLYHRKRPKRTIGNDEHGIKD